MKAIFLILFCCLQLAEAQQPIWPSDDNHFYVFSSTVDYYFEHKDLIDTSLNNYKNEQFRLKLDPKIVQEYDGWLEDDTWLWDVVLQHLEDGALMAYNTADGQTIPTGTVLEQLVEMDTVVSCFSPHFEEEYYHFITTYPDCMGWRLHLDWGWNDSRQQLESKLSAIAPIFRVNDENGLFRYKDSPIFFRTVTTIDSQENAINNRKWAWAGQAKTMMNWQNIEMLKEDTKTNFVESIFYQKALVDQSMPLYHAESDWWPEQQMTSAEVEQIKCQTDSLFIMHPETFELRDTTVIHCLKPEDIQATKLYYRLYFDPTTATFAYQPLAVQPVLEALNEEGDFIYYAPLFLLPFE